MRSPDEETEGSQTEGTETGSTETEGASISPLADGFAGEGDGDGGGDENAFGSGWPGSSGSSGSEDDGSLADQPFFAAQPDGSSDAESHESPESVESLGSFESFDGFDGAGGREPSAFELGSDDAPDTDADWDVTGDGLVDQHDFDEAATGFGGFDVAPDDGQGPAQTEGYFPTE